MINELKNLFKKANLAFLEKNRYLFEIEVSERTLCGALMLELYEYLKNTPYSDYYVDVEYNRHAGSIKAECKTILGPMNEVIPINCDLIVHNRGKNGVNDNLIALEMKKSYRPKAEKQKDIARLQYLTMQSDEAVKRYIGRMDPNTFFGYLLGVYYEVDYDEKKVTIILFSDGCPIDFESFSIF